MGEVELFSWDETSIILNGIDTAMFLVGGVAITLGIILGTILLLRSE